VYAEKIDTLCVPTVQVYFVHTETNIWPLTDRDTVTARCLRGKNRYRG